MNPWHDVEFGDHIEQHFRCVIEIPKGSKVKYEIDKQTGLLWLDRVLHCPLPGQLRLPAPDGLRGRRSAGRARAGPGAGRPAALPPPGPRHRRHHHEGRERPGRQDHRGACGRSRVRFLARHLGAAAPPDLWLRRFFIDYKALEEEAVDVEEIRGRADAEAAIRDAVRLSGSCPR